MEDISERINILVVDDRPDKLLALQTILEDLDQNLICVRSGAEALRELLKEEFAVILLDVNMPGMDGFETAALIRQRQRSETTPIIFVSAVNDAQTHVARGYSLGAVDYILMPVVPEILRAKVAVFVDLFRKTEQVRRQAEEHARFVHEKAARVAAEEGQERLSFLAVAGNVLAGSLDYDRTMENLARLAIPRLGHFCFVDRVDTSGELVRIAVAHQDAESEQMLLRLGRNSLGDMGEASVRVMASGLPEQRNDFDFAAIPGKKTDLPASLCGSTYLAIPIIMRGSAIGSITLVRTGVSDAYSINEVSMAVELVQRTALALDNASLYLEAQRTKEEAERANRAKDRFLAMLSHELRTPLTPVIVSIINLESEKSLSPQVRTALGVMRRNVELEARLIDDLLDLTRVNSGKIHLNLEPVNAHLLLQNAVEICQQDIQAKGLELKLYLDAPEFHLDADPARLQQIFWNLLRNATKFTDEGEITLVTRNTKGNFELEVIDTGIGMDRALVGRIFKPFEQCESGRHGGLGLGLAITKSLVEHHSGEISVTSPGPGHGSRFIVNFPTVASPAANSEAPPDIAPGSENMPLRILLVEDHVDTNESLTMLLKLRGHSVVSASDVRSAVELASCHEVDVLISDLGLPDGDAGQAMNEVARRYSAIGIALSGYGMEGDIRRSREYGFSHHLIKPVDVGRLNSILSDLAGRKSKNLQPRSQDQTEDIPKHVEVNLTKLPPGGGNNS